MTTTRLRPLFRGDGCFTAMDVSTGVATSGRAGMRCCCRLLTRCGRSLRGCSLGAVVPYCECFRAVVPFPLRLFSCLGPSYAVDAFAL